MPLCTFTTNLASKDVPENFEVELAEEVARVLGKPIEKVTVALHPGRRIYRNASAAPCAIFQIWSINVFSADKNPSYVSSFQAFISDKLCLPGVERIAISLHDLKREQVGLPAQ